MDDCGPRMGFIGVKPFSCGTSLPYCGSDRRNRGLCGCLGVCNSGAAAQLKGGMELIDAQYDNQCAGGRCIVAMSKKEIKRQDGLFTVRFFRILNRIAAALRRKRVVEGYMTVEASLIVPIVLGGTILLIMVMFFLHTRVLMSSAMYGRVIHASGLKEDDFERFMEKYRDMEPDSEMYTGSRVQNYKIRLSKDRITASMDAGMNFFVPFFFSRDESTGIRVQAIKTDPVKIIRNSRMAEKLLEAMNQKEEEKTE